MTMPVTQPIPSAPFQFFNVVPCSVGTEELAAKDSIELFEKTGINVALYWVSVHPEGRPAYEKVARLTESFRKFKTALKGSGVRPGILLQSILGHWIRVDDSEEPWEQSINLNGKTVRFCPLDPRFRKYIFDTVAGFAKEKPCFILGDDDIRTFFGAVSECFCPLHTAEFNRRMGTNFTQDEYREAVKACKVGDPVFNCFEKLREETVVGVGKLIRKAIDSVDRAIPSGSCMPGEERRFNGDVSRAMAAQGQPPVMRMANGMYYEYEHPEWKDFLSVTLFSQAQRQFHSNIPCVLDETDSFPHNLYSLSATTFHTKLCLAIFNGLNGAKIWCVNGHKFGYPVSRKYTDILAENKAFYPALSRAVAGTELAGVRSPAFYNFPDWHPSDARQFFVNLDDDMFTGLIGYYGIPYRVDFRKDAGGIYVLAGRDNAMRIPEEELLQLFRGKLFVDGPAAIALTERGFEDMLGVRAEKKDFQFNEEWSSDGKQQYSISKHPDIPFLTVLDPSAKVLTKYYFSPYPGALSRDEVAPGSVLFRNKTGGTVCMAGFHKRVRSGVSLGESRKDWMIMLFEQLLKKPLDWVADEYQPVTMLQRTADNKTDLLFLLNQGIDTIHPLTIRCGQFPTRVEQLLPDGTWEDLSFERNGNRIVLPVSLSYYGIAALRLTKQYEI